MIENGESLHEYQGPIPQNGYTTVPLVFIETLTPISR